MDNNKKINGLTEQIHNIQSDPMSEYSTCLYELEAVKEFFLLDMSITNKCAIEGMYAILFNIIARLEVIGEELCKRI